MYFFPISLPKPLQSGYSRKYQPNMIRTQMSDGNMRQRLINQGSPDSLSVTWMFNSEQFAEFLGWYKGNIRCGTDWFVCPILSNDDNSVDYQYCRIQKGMFTQTLVFRNEETAMYKVTCVLDVSNTVVDDGSWEDYYISAMLADEFFGKTMVVESAPIVNADALVEEEITEDVSEDLMLENNSVANIDSVVEEKEGGDYDKNLMIETNPNISIAIEEEEHSESFAVSTIENNEDYDEV